MFTLPLDSSQAELAIVGGKGANLARMVRAKLPVPGGFLITTAAYRRFVDEKGLQPIIDRALAGLDATNPAALQAASKQIRDTFAARVVPVKLARSIQLTYLAAFDGGQPAVAVRSSATAEDLPDMSFAGQQDTFLNVVGESALIEAVVNCWSSLWTARAIGYRARQGLGHGGVALAIVVQAMVPSEASGVLFTANPLNGRRTEMVIDATLGLGEALVAGQVEPDHYIVDAASGAIIDRRLGAKALAIIGRSGGGTETVTQDAAGRPAVPDDVIRELVALGRQVTALFDAPQDIEWAWLSDPGPAGTLYLLQSRPITSLFPVPLVTVTRTTPLHGFFSFGAVQGMLDPMTPLGQDVIMALFAGLGRLVGLEHTAQTQSALVVAGERLWVNMTPMLRHPLGRRFARRILPMIEPSLAATIATVLEDPRLEPASNWFRWITLRRVLGIILPLLPRFARALLWPEAARQRAQRRFETFLAEVDPQKRSLADQVDFMEQVLARMFRELVVTLVPALGPGMASLALLTRLARDLPPDGTNPLTLTRGLPHNVTTEMDLSLWAAAQAIRADPAAHEYFAGREAAALADQYLAGQLPPAAQTAVAHFLDRYGMRGIGEIDFGRPRWNDDPTPVMQSLQSYLRIADANQAPDDVFARSAAAAEAAIPELAAALRRTRLGWLKAHIVRPAARRLRALSGLRESPKFTIIRAFGLFRAGLLAEARELAATRVLDQPEDIFFLHLDELRLLAGGQTSDRDWAGLVAGRRETYAREFRRRPIPRLLLSDGQAFYEGLGAAPGADANQLVGSPVSPGVVEGTVHVVLDPHRSQLSPGEILVCPGTDPAWTPLFLAAGGLVMEVGGLMTHGSVVAREYGIPAVVGVDRATTRLQSGQRVRVDGTSGTITLL